MPYRNLHRSGALLLALALAATPCWGVAGGGRPTDGKRSAARHVPPGPVRELVQEHRTLARLEATLDPADRQRLAEARVRLQLQPLFYPHPSHDPSHEWALRTVREGYLKMYRETMEERFPLDGLLEQRMGRRFRSLPAAGGGPSWRPLVSPRVALGSHGYVGVRLSFPHAGLPGLERATFQVRQGLEDGETAIGVRYADGPRFFQFERVTGDARRGDQYTASIRLRF